MESPTGPGKVGLQIWLVFPSSLKLVTPTTVERDVPSHTTLLSARILRTYCDSPLVTSVN